MLECVYPVTWGIFLKTVFVLTVQYFQDNKLLMLILSVKNGMEMFVFNVLIEPILNLMAYVTQLVITVTLGIDLMGFVFPAIKVLIWSMELVMSLQLTLLLLLI